MIPVCYLDDMSEVFPVDVIVSFDEDLSQDGFSDGVVFGVELVEAVERVSVLRRKRETSRGRWGDVNVRVCVWCGVSPRACPACRR